MVQDGIIPASSSGKGCRPSSTSGDQWHDARERASFRLSSSSNVSNGASGRRRSSKDSLMVAAAATSESARRLIRRTSSAVWQERPQTPAGWSVLMAAIASAIFGSELQVQRQLTCPPFVFVQNDDSANETMRAIYRILTQGGSSNDTNNKAGILAQAVQPSLWVGTRSSLSSGLAMVCGIPYHSDDHFRFREIVTMPLDGAKLALDWEAPSHIDENPKEHLLRGPIQKPIVLILHGINNDSNAGYIRALQRTMTNRGYVAIGMNFRGCGGIALATPRGYNGAYTGDLRSVVHTLESRLASGVPCFLVGHSLGANLVTKYLGEEGLSGSLPKCVAGGASLGNPLEIHSKNNMHTPWKQLLAWGVKLDLAMQWKSMQKCLVYPEIRRALWGAFKATSIHEMDEAFAPVVLRNDSYYPFATRIGYKNGEEYWEDASSYRFVKHVSVPLLQIIAGDDKLVYHSFLRKLTHSIRNPNVMCVETKCGGHLGWQESPPPSSTNSSDGFGVGPSWAGRATADFIDAILATRRHQAEPQPSSTESGKSIEFSGLQTPWERPPNIPVCAESPQVPVLQSRL